MAIDRTFEAALQKAVRSLENNRGSLLWEEPSWAGEDNIELTADDDRIMAAGRGLQAARFG